MRRLLLGAALVAAGCGENAGPEAPRWNACDLLPPEAVAAYGLALGASLDAGVTKVEGATDFPWPAPTPDAGALRVAQSRCAYRVGDGAQAWTIALAARLSESDDVSAADLKELLANEGYPPAFDTPLECADQAFLTSFSTAGALGSAGGAPARRSELHLLLSRPSKRPTPACAVPDGAAPLPLHAYAVLFATNAPRSGPVADAALVAMGLVVRDGIFAAMERLDGFERAPPDAGPGADGDAQDAPADDAGASDAPPPASIALADFPGAAADAWCGRVYECCSPDERLGGALTGGSPADCRFQVALSLGVAFSTADDEADAGRVSYDPAAAAACLANLRTSACATLTQRAAELPCADALHPAVASGGACASDLDCVNGYCRRDADAGEAPGACAAHAEVGAACDADHACVTGSCLAGACAARVTRPWCQGP